MNANRGETPAHPRARAASSLVRGHETRAAREHPKDESGTLMHVVHIINNLPVGGAERFLLQLSAALGSHGVRTTVVSGAAESTRR